MYNLVLLKALKYVNSIVHLAWYTTAKSFFVTWTQNLTLDLAAWFLIRNFDIHLRFMHNNTTVQVDYPVKRLSYTVYWICIDISTTENIAGPLQRLLCLLVGMGRRFVQKIIWSISNLITTHNLNLQSFPKLCEALYTIARLEIAYVFLHFHH